jgi:hypothetical protein
VKLLPGKGGAQFSDFAAMCANVGGARIVVCINAYTDTTNSAAAFAAYARSNHIAVAAWELANEPYTLTGTNAGDFFTTATDYATKMKPYRDAIKSADSNAVVAIFFEDAGYPEPDAWDLALSTDPNKYWDAVVYHHYPSLNAYAGNFADLMALDNWQLISNTTARMLDYLIPMNNSNVTFLITEYAPAEGNGTGGQNPPSSSLYGGIYSAEYSLRMSTLPQMSFVGPYQLLDANGINQTNSFNQAVLTALAENRTTNTAGLPFGFFLSAQACGEAVADWALTRSTMVYATTVGTNGPSVPIDIAGTALMPAVYAQAYQGGNGKRYLVLTNKGSNAVPVQITQDGAMLTNLLLETFVTGSDPSAVNSNPPTNNVVIQTLTATNPVTIPEYSVVRLEWTLFTVPSTAVSITWSNQAPLLGWSGLTNVVYDVEAATNLLATWPTLGKVACVQTNFNFSDPVRNNRRFYRLTVP